MKSRHVVVVNHGSAKITLMRVDLRANPGSARPKLQGLVANPGSPSLRNDITTL